MNAWGKDQNVGDNVLMLADGNADFTKAVGLEMDGTGFGMGMRFNLGAQAAAVFEGRFFQVPNSAIQTLEGRANFSFLLGPPRETQLLNGTLGPTVGLLGRLSGAFESRGPTLGVRFRRDTKKAGSLGLQVEYAPLRVTTSCTSGCEPFAILFAPGAGINSTGVADKARICADVSGIMSCSRFLVSSALRA